MHASALLAALASRLRPIAVGALDGCDVNQVDQKPTRRDADTHASQAGGRSNEVALPIAPHLTAAGSGWNGPKAE